MAANKKKDKYSIESIGLAGLNDQFKLCHLPFLVANDVFGVLALEGSSGTGKTTIVKRLGQLNQAVTGEDYGVFSADKARYEDFIGCPIPCNETHTMRMYHMPHSVATKSLLLVDEINRASYENQEKWLSLFATRKIDSIDVKCRYIYAAMNPILKEKDTDDTYEGVQPLDKALGERMMALLKMPSFGKLDPSQRQAILKSGMNQTSWSPTEEAVEAHRKFIQNAREEYENAKAQALDKICDYVDAIQADLRKETKNALSIEARRAQYIVTNILGVFALNAVNKVATLEQSALEALLISFPNPLWEQPINREQLKAAHNANVALLKLTMEQRKKNALNFFDLRQPLDVVLNKSKEGVAKEEITKQIMNLMPDSEDDPINHFVYALGAVKGFTMSKGGKSKKQNVMKEEEFSRLERIFNSVIESDSYIQLKKVMESLINTADYPKDFTVPDFVTNASEENADKVFRDLMKHEVGVMSMSIAMMPGVEINSLTELLAVGEKIAQALSVFKEVSLAYEK